VAPAGEVLAFGAATSTVYVGGSFGMYNALPRNGLAAFDLQAHTITGWNPQFDSTSNVAVAALAHSDGVIYAGGGFSAASGNARNLAAFDGATGAATDWMPQVSGDIAALVINETSIYAGGSFTNISGTARTNLASFDRLKTNALSDWNPAPNGRVSALALDATTLYAGGAFTTISGQPRRRIASFDSATNSLSAWAPEATGTSTSSILAIAPAGDRIYLGGLFLSIGGQFRTNIAAVDTTTGSALDWNPNVNNAVWAIAPFGTNIYLGGDFSAVSGQPHASVVAVSSETGLPSAWSPAPNSRVLAIAPTDGGVYLGGLFTLLGSTSFATPRPYLAFFGTPGYASLGASLAEGVFQLRLNGNVGELYEIQVSHELTSWTALSTNRNSNGVLVLSNPENTNSSAAFFRTRALTP
jgi:hypothetical protein